MARLFAIVLFPVLCHSAWVKSEMPPFEIYSSAGASAGRNIVRRLAQIRAFFEERTGRKDLTPLPVRVMIFADEADFRSLGFRSGAAGFYQSGTDQDYVAMLARASDLERVAAHEYVHVLLRHSADRVPPWLNEGLAEVWSTVTIEGTVAHAGDPVPGHLAKLGSMPLQPLERLFAADDNTVSYEQSWAIIHMLAFSEAYAAGFPVFVSLVLSGSEPGGALFEAFHRSSADVQRDLASYIRRQPLPTVRIATVAARAAVHHSEHIVTAREADLLRWEMLVATKNYARSDEFLRGVAARYPDDAEVWHALGDAAQRRNESPQAAEHYRRAIAMGSKSGQLRYDLAMVRRSIGAPEPELISLLWEAVRLEPRLFDAQFLLGYLLLKSGRREEAVHPLRWAVSLRPWSAAAKDQLMLAQAPPIPPAVRVKPPEPNQAPAPEVVHGSLTQVDCLGQRARLHVAVDKSRVFLLVRDPTNVFLHNAGPGWTRLPCGQVPRQRVSVAYRRNPDATLGTAGDVVSITFGDQTR